ncbi:hypothetical protein ACWOE5_08185 [Aerococcus sanguinicola]|uniref:Uncharacterized protein n=1 Tax=Aerococcus sanguinicola TaxID=119206 RepID=A0A0X8FB12_9LACT|nr:hypothetical protein [Aerococcus sanguinicola]AMB94034.1 hypothetical protein AWM72_04280 [Aerococcus sanguinicola]MDK7050677.1 hypothetical protein [Aerococcus sanguinicola]PKZ20803.1 hypothetical protein CYJ28_09280 [Aerococcus sanguinicola]
MLGVSRNKGKPRLHVSDLRKHSKAALASPTEGCEGARVEEEPLLRDRTRLKGVRAGAQLDQSPIGLADCGLGAFNPQLSHSSVGCQAPAPNQGD